MVSVVGLMVLNPVVWHVLHTVAIKVLIEMLGEALGLVTMRVVVFSVMSALWLDIMVLAVLLAAEVALVVEVRHVILQIPVALLKVSFRVVLLTTSQEIVLLMSFAILMVVLIRSFLVVETMSLVESKVLFLVRIHVVERDGLVLHGLLVAVVHFLVVVGCLGSHMLLGLSLSSWHSWVMIGAEMFLFIMIKVMLTSVRLLMQVVSLLTMSRDMPLSAEFLLSVWVEVLSFTVVSLSFSVVW